MDHILLLLSFPLQHVHHQNSDVMTDDAYRAYTVVMEIKIALTVKMRKVVVSILFL